ncbi:integrin alpha-IIb [Sceloporus undulatus]|uniref:integrin alpha-IIb n=1 Tax=Sceloporus undulatus TaxID=8520 RepID=UPI001C4BE4BA|nr:integrin alpha-IIb [Sceloporus undulatus]
MTGGHGSLGLLALFWLLMGGFLPIYLPVWSLNFQAGAPIVYSGPHGSYFGFALDFYQDSKGSMNVVVGAPQANTSQPDVMEAGSVYLCPWVLSGSNCTPIEFDTKGDQVMQDDHITMKVFKSKQWFGASVSTWKDNILACAPLQHWNALEGQKEATKTPVGNCFLASEGLQRFSEYSPCRDIQMESFYSPYYFDDKRYCEIGFSAAISNSGKALLGAPGGYYFGGLFSSVSLSAIQSSFPGYTSLLWTVKPEDMTSDYSDSSYDDAYRGYSVALGEFNENPESAEYVVGVPNKSETQGVVEIFTLKYVFRVLWTIRSEQIASYFGHTVAVADINGDGKDDILVGAPLFLERHSDLKLYEVGRVYLYIQRKTPNAYNTPWQTLTGTDVYGRFGMAIAPLGDTDQDGYVDIAVGAPFAGRDKGGRVYIYHGCSEGLSTSPKQILESPFSGPAGFGFAIRGASDVDGNGYPDVLVGAYRVSKVAVYRAQPVVVVKAQLVLPDALNPEDKTCGAPGAKASCFTIQMCVGVSGKSMPQKIDLHAELQLDRMKQKFGRRVFLQQNSQSSRMFIFELSQKIPQTCQNVTAYLKDETEFKDKLSPIVVSLNVSLKSTSNTEDLQPVLYGQLMVQEQTHIILNCGDDNICIPNLKLSAHTNEGSLLIGADNVLLIQATAVNDGEGAYETELVAELPTGAYFQRANSSTQKLICNSRKENETHLVACEVGNPMKAGTLIKVDLELSVSQLENAANTISFMLQLKSKNTLNSSSNVVRLPVPVKAAAKMELLGISAPAALVLPVITEDYKNKSKKVDDYGPKVEHVYRLQNAGPSTVSGAELLVDFPNKFWESFLLYITRVSTEGNVTCSSMNETNPLKLELQEAMTTPSSNMTGQRGRWRQKRDVSPASLEEPVLVNCSSQICAVLRCRVGLLERGQGAMVTIHAILWLQSFQERPLEQFLIQSQAWFNTSGMPYHIQPEVLPSGSSLAETLVERVNPDAEREIPVWWIIVAVLVGLLLLATFIIILWKTGFFKRKRPPTEEEEQLTNEHGA